MIVFGVNFENVYKELSGYSAIIILTNGPRSCKFFEQKFEKINYVGGYTEYEL